MNAKRKAIIASNEISEIRTYTLGGFPQKVLIDGKKKSNPMVIFLHGGPGSPIPFSEGCRGMFPEITDKFTMVYWDQLGCGINNHPIDDSFSADDFVDMTVDLIKQIKADFPDTSLNIFAVSWGTILSAKAVERVPELIDGVVTYGHILKNLSFNNEVYTALENSKMPQKLKARLAEIKSSPEHTVDQIKTVSGWIMKYTDGTMNRNGAKAPLGKILMGIMTSPDYSMKDFKAMVINGCSKNTSLFQGLITVDLSETLENITVPYFIIQGETDLVTPTKMISEFVKTAGNKNLSCDIVKNSAHTPSADAMDYIINTGFEFLKK